MRPEYERSACDLITEDINKDGICDIKDCHGNVATVYLREVKHGTILPLIEGFTAAQCSLSVSPFGFMCDSGSFLVGYTNYYSTTAEGSFKIYDIAECQAPDVGGPHSLEIDSNVLIICHS